jgi:hypothetical protein
LAIATRVVVTAVPECVKQRLEWRSSASRSYPRLLAELYHFI